MQHGSARARKPGAAWARGGGRAAAAAAAAVAEVAVAEVAAAEAAAAAVAEAATAKAAAAEAATAKAAIELAAASAAAGQQTMGAALFKSTPSTELWAWASAGVSWSVDRGWWLTARARALWRLATMHAASRWGRSGACTHAVAGAGATRSKRAP